MFWRVVNTVVAVFHREWPEWRLESCLLARKHCCHFLRHAINCSSVHLLQLILRTEWVSVLKWTNSPPHDLSCLCLQDYHLGRMSPLWRCRAMLWNMQCRAGQHWTKIKTNFCWKVSFWLWIFAKTTTDNRVNFLYFQQITKFWNWEWRATGGQTKWRLDKGYGGLPARSVAAFDFLLI